MEIYLCADCNMMGAIPYTVRCVYCTQRAKISLGKRKEEEPDTDTKWIEDAYATYDSDPRACGPLDYEAFKQAILSHLPKQWKTQATPEK